MNIQNETIDRLITVKEAQGMLALGQTAVFALLKDGTLPRLKCGGSTRIRLSDIQAYISSLRPQNQRAA